MITDKDCFAAIFTLAGIEVTRWHEVANKYWPPAYTDMREAHPWQLAMTKHGPITIGWRKNVISINWEDTSAKVMVTEDDVTKKETLVHAWSYADAVKYMTVLGREFRRIELLFTGPATKDEP